MDQVRHLSRIVYTLFDLDAEPLVVAGIDRAGGYLPDKIHSLGRLETVEEPGMHWNGWTISCSH